jgi:hypothetical protein
MYKKGLDNKVVDALSRRPCDSTNCYAISTSQPQWLEQMPQSYLSDTFAQEILTKLAVDSNCCQPYTLNQLLLRYKGRLWIGNDADLKL